MKKFVLLILAMLLSSCVMGIRTYHPGPPLHARSHIVHSEFYYYPGAEVYFNPATKTYIFFSNGLWTHTTTRPAIIVSPNLYVKIVDDKGTPWVRHNNHKQKYLKTHFKTAPKSKPKNKDKYEDKRRDTNKDKRRDTNKDKPDKDKSKSKSQDKSKSKGKGKGR